MLERLLPLELRRRRLLRKSAPGPLRDYLSTPLPGRREDARRVEYLAVDLETTGLSADRDEIVSIGMVTLSGNRIDLSTATHLLIRPQQAMPEASAVIHRITDDRAQEGMEMEVALRELLRQLRGRVLIAHHAPFEWRFLDRACQRCYGGRFLAVVVDTQAVARCWLERRGRSFRTRDLRLDALREWYSLPRYPAHNALSDAVAAAELFLAQLGQRESERSLPLKEFTHSI